MQDELFLRLWNQGHDDLSTTMDEGLRALANRVRSSAKIGQAYASDCANSLRHRARLTAVGVVAGLAMGIAVGSAGLATPNANVTPAIADGLEGTALVILA